MKPTETKAPLLDRLRSWAQNEEMIDQYYTQHGKDCNAAADVLADLLALTVAIDAYFAYTWDAPLGQQARAIIAKAKGE